jgi:hypothetical protein
MGHPKIDPLSGARGGVHRVVIVVNAVFCLPRALLLLIFCHRGRREPELDKSNNPRRHARGSVFCEYSIALRRKSQKEGRGVRQGRAGGREGFVDISDSRTPSPAGGNWSKSSRLSSSDDICNWLLLRNPVRL